MLPLTVLRRLDCVLADTKPAVLAADRQYRGLGLPDPLRETRLNRAAGQHFHNTSDFDL